MPLIAAGAGLVGSIFGSRSRSKSESKARRRAAAASQARPATLNTGFGLTQVGGPDNTITQDQNQFTDLSRLFANQAQNFLGQAGQPLFDLSQTGFTPQAIGGFGGQVAGQFDALRGAIGGQPQFDPNAFAQTQFDRLQSLAGRGEELAANKVANNLFARGRLGADDTATGAAFEGLARAQGDARTGRALTATQLANQEAQRLFGQNQTGIQNQFGLLNNLVGQQQAGVQNFLGLAGFNQTGLQQMLQNALGFGGAAGSVLAPNFQALNQAINLRSSDQAARAGVAPSLIQAGTNSGQARADLIGNAFSSFADAFRNR